MDSEERFEAALVLFVISDGVDRERVAPILCGALAAEETREPVLAAGILARAGMEVSRSVSVLIDALGHTYERYTAIQSLGSIGLPAASAIPDLLRVAEERGDQTVIDLVADAVARIRVE